MKASKRLFSRGGRTAASTVLLVLLSPLCAQEEAKFLAKQADALNKYAAAALRAGFPTIARPILLEILSEYGKDNADARKRLGYVRFGRTWVIREGYFYPQGDNPSTPAAQQLRSKWASVAKSIGRAHKGFAVALRDAGQEKRAMYHFSRALRFAPGDSEVTAALGHKKFAGMSGTDIEETVFQRSRMMDRVVKREQKKEYPVKVVSGAEQLSFIAKAGFECLCVKSEHFTVWGEWDEKILIEAARNSERALAFCKEALTGSERFAESKIRAKIFVYLKNKDHFKKVLRDSPDLIPDESRRKFIIEKTGSTEVGAGDRRVQLVGPSAEAVIPDAAVRFVVRPFSSLRSDALVEGIGHAVVGRFFDRNLIFSVAQQKGRTVTNMRRKLLLPDMDTWLELAIETAFNPKATKAARLPLLKASRFPTDGRIKAWSFCDYLLRRNPVLLIELDRTRGGKTEEEVRQRFLKDTKVSLELLEREWKDFWTGATPVLAALRKKVDTLGAGSKDAPKWLREFNKLRFLWKDAKTKRTSDVRWSSSHSRRCRQHATYLKFNRRARGPAAEQGQDEDGKGGTQAGSVFAGMALVSTKGSPAKAMADWIHIPGYRDALLHPYLVSVGLYAAGSIAVFDVVRGVQMPEGKYNSRLWPVGKGTERELAVKLLGPEVAEELKTRGIKAKTIGYPISAHRLVSKNMPAGVKWKVVAGGKKVEGFFLTGGWNRHTSAPGMGVFYPLEPLASGVKVSVTFTGPDGKEIAHWSFTPK